MSILSPGTPEAAAYLPGAHNLAHTHSVSMSRFEGDPVRPSSKNLADIANHLPSPSPIYVPDRSPDAMKERRERKQAHRLMLHDNPKAFNRRKVRGSLSTFLEEGMAMKHLVGEVHQPRDHLNVCHPKAGYTYSRMTKDADGPEFYDCEYSSVRPRTVGYSPGHNRSLAASPSQGSLNSALSLGSPTRFNTRSEADTYIIANKKRVEEVDRRRTRHFRNLQTAKERRELATEVHTSIGAFEVKLRATQRDLKNQDDDDDDL